MTANSPSVADTRLPMPAPQAQARRVLVIEDNLDTVHSFVELLRDMGHHVEYAINGYAAIEAARQLAPDLVFLDIGLPGMNGFEVCERLRKLPGLEQVRIVSVTGYSQDEYRQRALAAGCERHFVKPMSVDQVTELLAATPGITRQ